MGLQSFQDKLPPALSWQPEGSLPASSTPMSDLSFGLDSIHSKQSLGGERVSLASKQMALSVLDILATKPPGPMESAVDSAGIAPSIELPSSSDNKPAAMHTEASLRSLTALLLYCLGWQAICVGKTDFLAHCNVLWA